MSIVNLKYSHGEKPHQMYRLTWMVSIKTYFRILPYQALVLWPLRSPVLHHTPGPENRNSKFSNFFRQYPLTYKSSLLAGLPASMPASILTAFGEALGFRINFPLRGSFTIASTLYSPGLMQLHRPRFPACCRYRR
jgi:hypothetical protein